MDNHLLDIFLVNERSLPYVETDDSKSYLHHFSTKMSEYIEDLSKLDEDNLGGLDKEYFIARISWIVKKLQKILRIYLAGHPADAYWHFKKLIKKGELKTELIYARTLFVDSGHRFFRTKKEYNKSGLKYYSKGNGFNNNLNPSDLFHVPFEKRRAIGSNRFSIPGYPCLYLSDSLKTSWSECIEDKKDPFHATSFKNHRPIYLIDLVPIDYTVKINGGKLPEIMFAKKDKVKVINDYAFMFPLVFACHSKVKYVESYKGEIIFKSEYIIPQLLLQWYKEQNLIVDGIRYLSCTAESRFPSDTFSKFNYVLPATTSCESGLCQSLLINYSGTPVFSYIEEDTIDLDAILHQITTSLNSSSFFKLV